MIVLATLGEPSWWDEVGSCCCIGLVVLVPQPFNHSGDGWPSLLMVDRCTGIIGCLVESATSSGFVFFHHEFGNSSSLVEVCVPCWHNVYLFRRKTGI